MIKHNIKNFSYAILGLSLITYFIIFFFTQDLSEIDFFKAIKHISTTITINLIIWIFFINIGWKWKVFYPWLVQFPDLSGEWEGTLKSNWKEKALDPIPIEVSIHQTFFNTQIKIKTGESISHSVGASFDIDKDRGFQELFYSYLNTPKSGVRHRSEIHYGSTRLNFEGFEVNELEGEYWTSRETTGEINLTRKK